MIEQKKILYKVVGKYHRYGTNMTGYMFNEDLNAKGAKKVLADWPKLKPFFPRYRKGDIVHAAPGSVGLLCFENIEDAKLFILQYYSLRSKGKVIRVEPLVEYTRVVGLLKGGCMKIGDLMFDKDSTTDTPAPIGTVAVRAVKVLE